ncbi:bifunctional 4-hydroxy-2-oxoglutarate aldolase/2-dehydro-3-deoxy-phosphogluconate aldolase [Paenibacillus sp. J31TS4]|uniref:bifunctional 4-hydroxy-2-oxoglutarate aldolase/2-dehydro-3-deoxy-phosphogluconate aldolase n=1 Tax=Paenibacillus sp. J31TS4 TaxID=2807195 RepID=UPI001BCAE07F|nr:bifunctional 4-hydroxy-2-oxoglutarate aldolase/2-dehydro-3-deoxy-phosphogluconate aldolase [Paenibacillus sp. J31TS4]
MNREQGLQQIEQTRLIAILRGVEHKDVFRIADALLAGGVTVMEITLNTEGAAGMIADLQKEYGDRMFIGAGTVLDAEDARRALDAGASFLVTPNTDPEVIHMGVEAGLPVYPGAMTPTEIVTAWKAGATAVKVFPSTGLGLPYLKELMGPLNHIPLVAVGGVNEDNVGDFLRAGCSAVGIGGSLINLKEIAAGNFDWVRDKASRLTGAIQAAR